MYNPDYYGVQNIGWTCPKCGRTYAPNISQCLYCNDSRVVYATHTSAKPKWVYEEDDTTAGNIYDNEWWKTAINMSSTWEDMIRRAGILEDD